MEPSDQREILNVRQTAQRLDVHENTVRAWVRSGLLKSARVPGSRFHRFYADDVERLKRKRGESVSSAADDRRVVGPELVDASSLHQWAATKDAQSRLPELVRRLLVSTPGITQISVRAGEGIALSGWDGRADSAGTAFLPAGRLRIEIGVGQAPKAKADEDFEKRRSSPGASSEVFVFITPRRWRDGAKWAEARALEQAFAAVVVLDADDLEGWLQATPAAHFWISERLGRSPEDGLSLDLWWERFSNRTTPSLPPDLFVAGRDAQSKQLLAALEGGVSATSVSTAWVPDAIAFIAATLLAANDREVARVALPLVVGSSSVWNRAVQQSGRMILIPTFDEPDVAAALDRGHRVVVPVGRDALATGAQISLSPPGRPEAQEALTRAGVNSERSYDLAALCRRSMPSLIRKLAKEPRFARPLWAQPPAASLLAPLVLVGRWTASEDDRKVVEAVTGSDWRAVEDILRQWHSSDDPPFVLTGGEWHVSSSDEALLLLQDLLTSSAIDRWRRAVIDVLLERDPRLDLPENRRPMAAMIGATRAYSGVLRRGLAEGVALLGAAGDGTVGDGQSASSVARATVAELLRRTAEDASGKLWMSLADVLPLVAESAPAVFLDAVHDDLDQGNPKLGAMFQDGNGIDPMFSSSPHTGLLWALETLCWSHEFLPSAAEALARLQEIDPGGRLSNRPLNSLDHVLVGWVRHTGASNAQKLAVVRAMSERQPEVAWQLVLKLWPANDAISSPPHAPRFRDWRPDGASVSMGDWFDFADGIVAEAEKLAGVDADRWAVLATRLGSVAEEVRTRLLAGLAALADGAQAMDQDARLRLWDAVQTEVARHRRFSDATWSLDDQVLSAMESIAVRLDDPSRPERFAYLFEWRPDLPEVERHDHAAYDARLKELRHDAIEEVLAAGSLVGVSALASQVAVPRHLGLALAEVLEDDQQWLILDWLMSDSEALVHVAAGFVFQRTSQAGEWTANALDRIDPDSTDHRLRLVLNSPAGTQLWDLLSENYPELHDAYWRSASVTWAGADEVARAVRELMAHDRPWAGIDLLAMLTVGADAAIEKLTAPLICEILDLALENESETPTSQSIGYEVGVLLDRLDDLGTTAEIVARYEYAFFGLLRHNRRPRALGEALATDPSLFVTMVERVYRAKHDRGSTPSERDSALAHHAWMVLNDWDDRSDRTRDPDELPSVRGWLPGYADGRVDRAELTRWVREARDALAESGRADIGDECIGNVLARSPTGEDAIWPAEAIRELIEEVGSVDIDTGVYLGVVNGRGVASRGVFDNGDQERSLASLYRGWERATAGRWRRTSRILRRLADSYESDARREDDRAKLRGDVE
jgi:excisionase family DNA binding protein